MRSFRLGVIIVWQVITLAVSTGLGFWGVNIRYDDGFNNTLQIVVFSVCGVLGAIWFFLSLAAFPQCVSELYYAHDFTREKSTMLFGWLGVLSALLAVTALGVGIFVFVT